MGFVVLKGWFNDLLRIVYPDVCEVCGCSLVRGEEVMCLKCDMNMPVEGYATGRVGPYPGNVSAEGSSYVCITMDYDA